MRLIPTVVVATLLTIAPAAGAAGPPGGEGAPGRRPAVAPLKHAERSILRAQEPGRLEALRGATGDERCGLGSDVRAALADVERCSSELERLRAGEVNLTDDEVKLILITAAVVIVIAVIV
jgi:hypothetical protein